MSSLYIFLAHSRIEAVIGINGKWLKWKIHVQESPKAGLLQEGIFFCTQFPSLGFFTNTKVGPQRNKFLSQNSKEVYGPYLQM